MLFGRGAFVPGEVHVARLLDERSARRYRSWSAGQISSGQQSVKLEPKVMALLVYLAERPGQTVSRDELLDGLWGGVAVVEEALTRCVSQLRRALADDTQEPRYIQTVSKRGYRLVAPVVLDDSRRFESREAAPVPHEPQLALVARESKEKRTIPIVAGVLTIALVATLIPVVSLFRSSATSNLDVRFTIDVPAMPSPYDIALSPNGRYVAYVAAAGQGRSLLWVRAVNSLDARALPHTEAATEPFWSPDSEYLAFGARTGVGSHLKKINISGGAVQTVTDLGSGNFCCGTWNRDGVIVFSHGGVLHRVPASGGEVTTISKLEPAREELFHARPQFLPDGRHFLYLAWSARPEHRFVHIGSLDSDTNIRLMPTDRL